MKWICVEVRMEVTNSDYPRLVRILRFGEFFESYEKVKLNDPIDCTLIKVITDSNFPNQCFYSKMSHLRWSYSLKLCPRETFIFQRGDNVSHWLNSSFEFLSEAKKTKNHEAFYLCDSSSTSLRMVFKLFLQSRRLIGLKISNPRLTGIDRVKII